MRCRRCWKKFKQIKQEKLCLKCEGIYKRRKDRIFLTINYDKLMALKKELDKMPYSEAIEDY